MSGPWFCSKQKALLGLHTRYRHLWQKFEHSDQISPFGSLKNQHAITFYRVFLLPPQTFLLIPSHPSMAMNSSMDTVMTFGTALDHILLQLDDPLDRNAASLVSQKWYEIEASTRKHVKIAMCYSIRPVRLKERFPHIESLKLKGKPRASMFNLIPEDWGGHAAPWINLISEGFPLLNSVHFRRMVVTDKDLDLLTRSRGRTLQVLKLDTCSGFSTDGLLLVTRGCRVLRTLALEESVIDEKDGEWLHELALNNKGVLETLSLYSTDLGKVAVQDLELLARKCCSLLSMKVSYHDIVSLVDFFHVAKALEEFLGGSFMLEPSRYPGLQFPKKLCCLGLTYMGRSEMLLIFPFASQLKKLDLLYAMLDADDHSELLQRCPNLEVLEARIVIGDRGLVTLAQSCKKLRRLRIERGSEEEEAELELVSHVGLISLAQGCSELEYVAVYVCDITNAALESIGTFCKKVSDFRLVLLQRRRYVTELPLDTGVRALLRGCQRLRRFALYLRAGGLTDTGLSYIGLYSQNVRWMLLGDVGESDKGLLDFSKGCPKLQKLEMRNCRFSERALAEAALRLTSLRYLWVQGYREPATRRDLGRELLMMVRPFWNIEFIPPSHQYITDDQGNLTVMKHNAQIFAYYSLAGQRKDCPASVLPLDRLMNYVNNPDFMLTLP